MHKSIEAEIKSFVAERDEMLLSMDLDRLIAFHVKHNPKLPIPSRQVAELLLHKARTGAKSLPIEARLESKRWLAGRGLSSMDDGDLLN